MALDRSGAFRVIPAVVAKTASDTSKPTAATDGVGIPADARGGLVHVLLQLTASDTSGSVIVTIFGYDPDLAIWFAITQLNGGAAIDRTTIMPSALRTNNVEYAEPLLHVASYSRLDARITSLAGTAASVKIWFALET